jgi:pectinesterase
MTPAPGALILVCIAVAVLAVPPWWGVAAHTRGVRPGNAAGQPFPENATRAQEVERLFMRWVRYVGALEHSTFQHAVARAFPSYSLVVDRNPASGDFTSIQAAVDSLPPINLVRVVIRVNAGTYTYVHCPPLPFHVCVPVSSSLIVAGLWQGEGVDIVDARVHHSGGRRRGQDGGAVGRHRRHAVRAEGPPTRHVRLGDVRRERAVLPRQEHHVQGNCRRCTLLACS